MNICSAWGYFEPGVFKIQGRAKLQDLHNTLHDQRIITASVTSLLVYYMKSCLVAPLSLSGEFLHRHCSQVLQLRRWKLL